VKASCVARTCNMISSWTIWFHCTPFHVVSLNHIVIFSHLHLVFPNSFFLSECAIRTFYVFLYCAFFPPRNYVGYYGSHSVINSYSVVLSLHKVICFMSVGITKYMQNIALYTGHLLCCLCLYGQACSCWYCHWLYFMFIGFRVFHSANW
jgi:hypothetical protein